jgi:hypothetical protein
MKEHDYSSEQFKPLLPSSTWLFLGQFKLLLLEDMIIPQGKKG